MAELPNVDIFDPIMCAQAWARCATQQQINVYLNQQISINRKVLTDTITAQNEINASVKGGLEGHEKRIAALETKVAALDTAQKNLNAAFQQLQTDNNNFKSNVDLLLNQYQTTINLLQQNIDKISVSNEQLWNEVNNIKSAIDIDKINAAIAGYQSVLADANKHTDEVAAEINAQLVELENAVANNYNTLNNKIDDNRAEYQTAFANFTQEVRTAINLQTAEMNQYRESVNLALQQQRTWMDNEVKRLDKRIDDLNLKVDGIEANNQEAHSQIRADIDAAKQEAAKNLTDSYNALKKFIDDNHAYVLNLEGAIQHSVDAINTRINALAESDTRQWDTINSILEAQNRINTNMENLYNYVNEQIKLVKADIASNTDRIAELEAGRQALELRAEYLEQRTGFKFRFSVKPGQNATQVYQVGFGAITVNTTTTQVAFAFNLAAGVSGMISVPATGYGMYNPIGTGNINIIANANNPDIVRGYIIGYADSSVPIEFMVIYNPADSSVTFVSQYETNEQVMPKSGAIVNPS